MLQEKYIEVINALCETLGIKDPTTQYEACHIEVDGVIFTLTYRPEKNPERLFIYCDCGKPPSEIREIALQRILGMNIESYKYASSQFGLNPETKHVLYMGYAPLKDLQVNNLINTLSQMATLIGQIKSNYFLSRKELKVLQMDKNNLAKNDSNVAQ